METKICPSCFETKSIDKFYRNEDGSIRKHVCMACYGKRDRAKLKLDAIKAFGGKCECCDEQHPYFLSLDHKNNDGAKQREQFNEQQIYRIARKEGWPRDKYQLLCMNCNFAKGHFGECPHKLGITVEQAMKQLEQTCFVTGRTYVVQNNEGLKLGPIAKMLRASGLAEEVVQTMLKQARGV